MSGSPSSSPSRRTALKPQHVEESDPTGRYVRFGDLLGRGADKHVFLAFDRCEGKEVAWNQVPVLPDVAQRLQSEVNLLSKLDHRNIIKMYASWHDPLQNNINFITELFMSGTLRQYSQRYRNVELSAIKRWSRQILRGLLYLHSHDPPIIHRDLKCDNIFVNGNRGELKIGDLGLAKIMEHKGREAHSVLGTPEFMAPELYDESYTELVDVYAFGMCLLEVVTGEYPYSECSNAAQVYKRVSEGRRPQSLALVRDPQVRHVIELCISPERRRPAVRELMMLPFLAEEPTRMGLNSMPHVNSGPQLSDVATEEGGRRYSFPLPGGAASFQVSDSRQQRLVFSPLSATLPYTGNQTWSPASSGATPVWDGGATVFPLRSLEEESGHSKDPLFPGRVNAWVGDEVISQELRESLANSSRHRMSDSSMTDTENDCHASGAASAVTAPSGSFVSAAGSTGIPVAVPPLLPVVQADRGFKIRGKLTSDSEVKLRLRIEDEDGNVQTVRFLFDLSEDTPLAVATEMIDELSLTDRDVTTISEKILAEIKRLVPTWRLPEEGFAESTADAGQAGDSEEVHQMELEEAATAPLNPFLSSPSSAESHFSTSFGSVDGTPEDLRARFGSASESPDPIPANASAAAAAAVRAVGTDFKGPKIPPRHVDKQDLKSLPASSRHAPSVLEQLQQLDSMDSEASPQREEKTASQLSEPLNHVEPSKERPADSKKIHHALPRRAVSISQSGRRILSRTTSRAFPANKLESNRCHSEQVAGVPSGVVVSPHLHRHDHAFHAAIPGHRAHIHSFRIPVQRSSSITHERSELQGTPPTGGAFWSGEMRLLSEETGDEESGGPSQALLGQQGDSRQRAKLPPSSRKVAVGHAVDGPLRSGSLLQGELKTETHVRVEQTAEPERSALPVEQAPATVGSLPTEAGSVEMFTSTNAQSHGRALGLSQMVMRNSGSLDARKRPASRTIGADRPQSPIGGRAFVSASSMDKLKFAGLSKAEAEVASYVELKVTWVQADEEHSVSVGAPGVDLKRLLHLEGAPQLLRDPTLSQASHVSHQTQESAAGERLRNPGAECSQAANCSSGRDSQVTVSDATCDEDASQIVSASKGETSQQDGNLDADASENEERDLNDMEEALTELLQHFALAPGGDASSLANL